MLLAVDTATDRIGLALHDGDVVLAEQMWVARGRATVELAPEVGRLLRRVEVRPDEIGAMALAIGPGSYTGLRIGLAFAKGFSQGRTLRLIAVPTLDVLARGQPSRPEPMLALLRAGRGRWAAAWYKWGRRGWKVEGETFVLGTSEMEDLLERPTYLCGEIGADERKALGKLRHARLAAPDWSIRRPGVLAQIGWEQLRANRTSDPLGLVPIYPGQIENRAG